MNSTKPYSTLFLDRDGVINKHLPDDYVKNVDEFVFLPGVFEALKTLSQLFDHIVVVTNQRGVGRQLMTIEDLELIHHEMSKSIASNDGRIDRIYYCIDTEKTSINRKPNTGMFKQATEDFPDMDISRSWMVGDSLSDMEFGNNSSLLCALIGNKCSSKQCDSVNINKHCPDLLNFANIMKEEANL